MDSPENIQINFYASAFCAVCGTTTAAKILPDNTLQCVQCKTIGKAMRQSCDKERDHTTPELAPVIRYCKACLQNRTRNIYGRCIVCNSPLKAEETFLETLDLLEDIKIEFVLLESIRQAAKEFCEEENKLTRVCNNPDSVIYFEKLDNLKHLVLTD